jgi:hypothetical protein
LFNYPSSSSKTLPIKSKAASVGKRTYEIAGDVATCVVPMTRSREQILSLKKITQPGEFNNLRRRQNGAD